MSQGDSMVSTTIFKRDGRLETFNPLKVERCLHRLTWGLEVTVLDVRDIVNTLEPKLPGDIMNADAFLIFLAEIVSGFSSRHPDFSVLAGRVYTCYHHKRVPKRFSTWVLSFENAFPPVFTDDVISIVRQHSDYLDSFVMHYRDFDFTYRAMHTFEHSYLITNGKELNERVQFLFMRTAIGIHGDNLDDVIQTYELLSTRKISFSAPALWNGGLAKRHFSSSYVYEPFVGTAEDTIAGVSSISRLWAADGALGICASHIPATRDSSGERHPGLLTSLKVYDSVASYWSKASRHRTSCATVYLPIWHADVRKFVLCRTTRAKQHQRFYNIYPALWIPNLFMKRLEADGVWSLFDPLCVGNLPNLYGDAFETEYEEYERLGLANTTVRARLLWDTVTEAVRESACPFIMYSDNINARNNQMHMGVVKSSNLCTEIVQHTSAIETAVSTLASVCLPRFLLPDGTFDYDELHRVTKFVVACLDRIVDFASYPTTDAAVSAIRTRSLGIGAQGLADLFAYMELPFSSPQAKDINVRVYETIYHASLQSSADLAVLYGHHDAWMESPAQQGVLQVDMWHTATSQFWNFDELRTQISRTGLRNSVLTAQMPTAPTAPLFGNSEGIEPYASNVIQFRILGDNIIELCRPLVRALQRRGLWTEQIRADILAAKGSVQTIAAIPDDLKAVFLTAFELDQRDIIDMAVDRAPFVDQSQSLTLFVAELSSSVFMDLQLRAWGAGLKTGSYYVRTKSAPIPLPFTAARFPPKSSASTSFHSNNTVFTDAPSFPPDN